MDFVTIVRFAHVLHSGRCHSISALFLAQCFDTSIQLRRSTLELSLAKTASNNSGGKRLTGDTRLSRSISSEGDIFISRSDNWPREDCESFRPAVKKSVSSS